MAQLIRPEGYYNIKAKRLKAFLKWLFEQHNGSLTEIESIHTENLRQELLQINGIGPETADSILLYALGKPVFVVDAYTRRMLERHGFQDETRDYAAMQGLFMRHLPPERALFNEYHALIVRLGKDHCRKKPECGNCPLGDSKTSCKTR